MINSHTTLLPIEILHHLVDPALIYPLFWLVWPEMWYIYHFIIIPSSLVIKTYIQKPERITLIKLSIQLTMLNNVYFDQRFEWYFLTPFLSRFPLLMVDGINLSNIILSSLGL